MSYKRTQQLQFSSGVITVCKADHPEKWNTYVSEWLKTNGMEGKLALLTEGPSGMYPVLITALKL